MLTSASSTHLDCKKVEANAKSAVRSGEAGSHAVEHLLDGWQYAACAHEAPNMLAAEGSAAESHEVY